MGKGGAKGKSKSSSSSSGQGKGGGKGKGNPTKGAWGPNSGQQAIPCRNWQQDGTCHFGAHCKFLHTGQPPQPQTRRTAGGKGGSAAAAADTRRFVQHLVVATPDKYAGLITGSGEMWNRCWEGAAAGAFDGSLLDGILAVLARLPPLAAAPAPPLIQCKSAIVKYVLAKAKDGQGDAVQAVEVVLNIVRRLLKFEWDVPVEEVKEALLEILDKANSVLQTRHKDQRELSTRVVEQMDELEKPWAIRQKVGGRRGAAPAEEEDGPLDDDVVDMTSHSAWRQPTIGWLCRPELFCPTMLPKMRVPGQKHEGVYDSREHYFDTVERLMVGMTFSDGYAALTPHCSLKECSSSLCPVPQDGALQCRTKNCYGKVVLACMDRRHNSSALCKRCADDVTKNLMGAPGPRASTNIYDGTVEYVDADGRMHICGFKSRCPPLHQIHWRSTRRLATPSLVGVVRLASFGASLRREDPILWGEVTSHGQPKDEAQRRQAGYLTVNMTSITGAFDPDTFGEGDYVAIIDCMTFVPEYVPVLRALEQQRQQSLPFDDGALFNMCASSPADLSNAVADDADLSNLPLLVQDMIAQSRLQPIVEIRRDPDLSSELNRKLTNLVISTTLDRGQLVSFIDALRNPVHLTQGPPGTGKSYLGVVIVRALMIIRGLWMTRNPSVGSPPILVLSYKNHAIDEFMIDLMKAEYSALSRSMVRIGGGTSMDPQLQQFSEKTFQRGDPEIAKCRSAVDKLHRIAAQCKFLSNHVGSFAGYRVEMFAPTHGDQEQKKRNLVAYEATEVLLASIIRAKMLSDAIEDYEEEGDWADVEDFFEKVEFLAEDPDDLRARNLQRKMAVDEVFENIPLLQEGIEHYLQFDDKYSDPGEILFMFIKGARPLPMCSYEGWQPCDSLSIAFEPPLCEYHRCAKSHRTRDWCVKPRHPRKWWCADHACSVADCQGESLPAPQHLCEMHACFKCVELGKIAGLAADEPPRNVCSEHPLCLSPDCLDLALAGKDYCKDHLPNERSFYNVRWRRKAQDAPEDKDEFASVSSGEDEKKQEPTKQAVSKCQGKNRKGKPCGATSLPGSKFCQVHAAAEDSFAAQRPQEAATPQPSAVPAPPGLAPEVGQAQPSQGEPAAKGKQEADRTDPPAQPPDAGVPPDDGGEGRDDHGGEEDGADFVDAVDGGRYDNQDEVEEGDHIQHLREVFDVDPDKDSDAGSDGESSADGAPLPGPVSPQASTNAPSAAPVPTRMPQDWTWDMKLEERWSSCQAFMEAQRPSLRYVLKEVKAHVPVARKKLQDAKVRANARVYENKSVIGGTIVGCISRLEAIKSTRPFAVIVEEASEVLEPLLFACLCPSTVKLEMIGDHLQLQPSLMQKFEFVRVNRVSVSMFERLIRAPAGHKVPSGVLCVQRRMRRDICDLTREYYKEIVEIEDHEYCGTKTIPLDPKKSSVWKGREVPGVQSHIYLWTHTGDQQKADVGLSKINRHEAEMAVWLAYYLVSCGVPRASIAILTPYKGQLMLMRSELLKDRSPERLLAWDSTQPDQLRLSTVDRFQGDEADVVIVSLVVDENSRTPFVKLVNRMIVLLSRARLGMYVLGNAGYFENSRQDIKHWNRTFEMLRQPPASSDNTDPTLGEVFDRARVGPELPLCCPQHPRSRAEVKEAKKLVLGFCKVPCEVRLSCTHPCGLDCHWPKKDHNQSCKVQVASPCARHPEELTCEAIFTHSTARKSDKIDTALLAFRCPKKVSVTLPCMHERKMACADERDISEGRASWPQCNERSSIPYTHVICKHTLEVTCHQLELYNRNPASVAECSEVVDYVPACGHGLQVKCYLKRQYEAGRANFTCPEKLEVSLPRCGHAKKVSCMQEIQLRAWTGTRCTEQDVVCEGEAYGPKDHTCDKQVTFQRPCGHQLRLRCEEAFDRARTVTACQEKVPCVNPHCGHPCQVPCSEAKKLRDMVQNDPVAVLKEGEIPAVPDALTSLTCTKEVTVQRKCGHVLKLPCSQASKALPKCKELCGVKNPLCGHDLSIPCHLKMALYAWQPWEAVWDSLVDEQTLPLGATPQVSEPPQEEIVKLLKGCNRALTVIRPCGHPAKFDCKQVLQIVTSGEVTGRCSEQVSGQLRCGHEVSLPCKKYRDYLDGKEQIVCKGKGVQPCWNAEVCGSCELSVPCGSTGVYFCPATARWTCKSGAHSYDLALCKEGTPNACPGCHADILEQAIAATERKDPPPVLDTLPLCFDRLPASQVVALQVPEPAVVHKARNLLLKKFKDRTSGEPPFKRQLFTPEVIPCLYRLEQSKMKDQEAGFFKLRTFVSENTLRGLQVYRLTPANLRLLGEGLSGSSTATLLAGYAYVVSVKVAQWPGKKHIKVAVKKWTEEGYDSMEESCQGLQRFVIWDPFPVYATHRITVSKADLQEAMSRCTGHVPSLEPRYPSFRKPAGKMQAGAPCPSPARGASASSAAAAPTSRGPLETVEELRGTWAEFILFPTAWDPSNLASGGAFPESVERDLMQKLSFINKEAAPFAGKNLLENLAKSTTSPLVELLLALEVQAMHDGERARQHLKAYFAALGNQAAHALALLALHRIDNMTFALGVFAGRYTAAAALLLSPSEKEVAMQADGQAAPSASQPLVVAADPAEMWEELKEASGCESEAMDKLLALTGLRKVKIAAVQLFKSAQTLQRMPAEVRKANAPALNYCFLGNPGTGKTTVARLFAEVLLDSGLRSQKTFIECTAQQAKDEGPDEFRKKAQAALDGVLFIDEAYNLDPVGDKFKGAPIVNELLTLAENERDRLTIILAGYEDDMNSKFFAFNDGLKSRFKEVVFEDFDEGELAQIWTHLREQRGWKEADERLTSVVVRKILKEAGRKGFGNARTVRKRLESATTSAMNRPDFDPDKMILEIVDVVGEDPRSNAKLQAVLEKINSMTGWAAIKKAVDDLVTVCGTNYERELDGQPPLPVCMNRMFLGNPGTGKTTCARMYGQVLKHLGFLSLGDVVFKTAGDLGGSVVGEAQQKTVDVLKGASGKVLVIDEAYNLDDNLYGKQVLDTLVEKVQGSENDDIAVLLLGYEGPMLTMLRNQNAGLARRFPAEQAFYFEDYSDTELLKILQDACRKKGIRATLEFQEKALKKLAMLRRSELNFGNAGAVNNLLQAALLKASARCKGADGEVSLEACDVDIGPEGDDAGDPLAPLDKLYRMEGVKKKLQQLSNTFAVAQQEGGETPELGHFVFTGSPGTGKTTVARVMAKILFELKLTTRNHVEETSGLNLTGEYVGQTKKKVEESLDAARGGVLFIDEAYELGKGPFGAEACTAIVAAMTDPKYAGLAIVIAGYQAEISDMLDTNPGLKSRFTHFFEFPDWSPDDCVSLFRKRAVAQNFHVEDGVEQLLCDGFAQLQPLNGWGNARDVDKLWKDSQRHRADRVAPAPETEKTLLRSDVQPALEQLLAARRGSSAPRRMPLRPVYDMPVQPPRTQQQEQTEIRREQGVQRSEEAEPAEEVPEASACQPCRDLGVSDEVWAELQQAIAEHKAREAEQLRQLEELRREAERREEELRRELEAEMERIRLETEAREREEAERRAKEAYEAKLRAEREERERAEQRRLEEIRKQQAIREKLRQLSPCPAGYQWYQSGGGWRCRGGSHFVSDAQLKASFTF